MYGKELMLDLHNCDPDTFTRASIKIFLIGVCEKIDMVRGPLHFWDYDDMEEEKEDAPPHLKGTSAIQFIMTSNIVIHTLDDLKAVYLNVFSCKDFVPDDVIALAKEWFHGTVAKRVTEIRV